MATRKKAKKKTTKAGKKKPEARKKVAKKARRPVARAKPRAKAKARPAPKPARPATPAAAPVPANEERIGIVTHYFSHLGVAIVKLERGVLNEGETVHIKGHTSDFMQPVGSMEINHAHVGTARAGESFGLKVKEHAREHDVVFKITAP
jgi:hypothetical protein